MSSCLTLKIGYINKTHTHTQIHRVELKTLYINFDSPLKKRFLRFISRKRLTIECFHMTSRRPYCCPKTMKRQPCWCPKPILWELNSFLMQTLSFVSINLRRCRPREWTIYWNLSAWWAYGLVNSRAVSQLIMRVNKPTVAYKLAPQ